MVLASGCEEDEVTRYQVPKSEPPSGALPLMTWPETWMKSSRKVPFSIATYEVFEGDSRAEFTLSPLKGEAGGLSLNVKRWRGQLGLKPVQDDEIEKELKAIEVAGAPAKLFDRSSPESDGEKRRRILGAIVPGKGVTWFFKMSGPAELVEKQKTTFEAFLKSVRFEGGSGAKP